MSSTQDAQEREATPEATNEAANEAAQQRKKKKRADPLIGRTIGGRYTITQRIGAGGMGVVYKAKQGAVDRDIAIKVLITKALEDEEQYESLVRRFHLEARAASRLSHPNTITVYDFGQDEDGMLYIAMEYLDGISLDRVLKTGAMAPQRVVRVIMQLCHSLAEAHQKNIVHRDIKPDNIFLITMGGDDDFVKVLDFGVAKIREPSQDKTLTKAGMIFGTPKYMSPEQARCLQLDSRSDVYSVGVLMYQMLMGTVPFDAEDHVSILLMHCSEPFEPFRKRRPDLDLPPELEAIVGRAMEKDRARRYQSIEEMAAALEQVAARFQFVASTSIMPIVSGYSTGSNPTVSPVNTPSGGMQSTLSGDSSGFSLFDTVGPDPTSLEMAAAASADASASLDAPPSVDGTPSGGQASPLMGKPNPAEVGLTNSGSYNWNGDLKLDLNNAPPNAAPPEPRGNKQNLIVMGVGGAVALLIVIVLAAVLFGGGSGNDTKPEPPAPVVNDKPKEPPPPELPVVPVEEADAGEVQADLADAGEPDEAVADNAADAGQQEAPPTEVSIAITSEPPGARITIDGKRLKERTPATITWPYDAEGKIEISLARPGYQSGTQTVTLDKDAEVELTLEKAARAGKNDGGGGNNNGGGNALPTADDLFKDFDKNK